MNTNQSRRTRSSMITPAAVRNELADIAEQIIEGLSPPGGRSHKTTRRTSALVFSNARKQFNSLIRDLNNA